jgi:hypothetical protein
MMLAATFAVGQTQDKKTSAGQEYFVVKMPFNIIEREYNSQGHERKPAAKPIRPLEELSAEGWDLVQAVYVEGASVKAGSGSAEGHGGDFVCFLRKRPSPSSTMK